MRSVNIGGTSIGEGFAVLAGPCSFESENHYQEIAEFLSQQGVSILRGGIYKSRTQSGLFSGSW